MNRKEGGRGLISVEDCITTESRGLYDYLKESKEDILSGPLKENVIEEEETKEGKERRLCIKESYKGKLQRKPGTLHSRFQKSGFAAQE